MVMFRPKRWNSTVYGKPRESATWFTLAISGEVRTSNSISAFGGVFASCGWACRSQAIAAPVGVVGSPSPVCQTPNLLRPAAVWKPHRPPVVLYSHTGLLLMFAGVLPG